MSPHFRTIDLSAFVLPGESEGRFSYADVPTASGIPFVIVHLKDEHDSNDSLRMDLNKRVFLGEVADEKLRGVASDIARHISGVAAPGPTAACPLEAARSPTAHSSSAGSIPGSGFAAC